MTRSAALREEAIGKLYEAKQLLRKDNSVAPGDQGRFDALMADFQNLDVDARMAAIAEARAAGRDSTPPRGPGDTPAPTTPAGVEEAIAYYTKPRGSATGPRVDGLPTMTGMVWPGGQAGRSALNGGPSLGQAFIDARNQLAGGFQAALVAPGSTPVAVPLRTTVIEDPRRARFVFQLIPEEDAPVGVFAYMKQTVRDLNAAVVATGAVKPESIFTVARTDGRTVVIAHVSEPIDRFTISDAPDLRRFIDDEMQLGLNIALDARVIAALQADATEGDQVDLAGIRHAITQLQILEMEPNAIVLSPTRWEAVEAEALETIAANDNAPAATEAMARRLYGIPVTISNGIADDVGLIGDFSQALLYRTGGIQIDVSDAAPRVVGPDTVSDFQLNQVMFRAELRAEVAVLRPSGFVAVGPVGS